MSDLNHIPHDFRGTPKKCSQCGVTPNRAASFYCRAARQDGAPTSLRARVEQLPVYTPDCTDGPRGGVIPFMLEEPLSGEWVKLADVLALLPPETAETPHHADGGPCPKCGAEMGHMSGLGKCGHCFAEQMDRDLRSWVDRFCRCPHGHDLTRVTCPHGCRT